MRSPRTAFAALVGTTLWLASTLGVAAQSPSTAQDPTAPAPFTGRIDAWTGDQLGYDKDRRRPCRVPGRSMGPDRPRDERSSPRRQGHLQQQHQFLHQPDGAAYEIGTSTWRIETDEGAWQGSYHGTYWEGIVPVGQTVVLVGEGAYEGPGHHLGAGHRHRRMGGPGRHSSRWPTRGARSAIERVTSGRDLMAGAPARPARPRRRAGCGRSRRTHRPPRTRLARAGGASRGDTSSAATAPPPPSAAPRQPRPTP